MADLEVEVAMGEGVRVPISARAVRSAVLHVLRAEGRERGEISITFLPDSEMTTLNRDYLGHDHATDVLAFALHAPGEAPVGDVYVGAEQGTRQAGELGVDAGEELLRLAVHGTLHVLGYDHPDGDDRLDSEMFRRQEALLGEILRDISSG